jgi:hypothetical protein
MPSDKVFMMVDPTRPYGRRLWALGLRTSDSAAIAGMREGGSATSSETRGRYGLLRGSESPPIRLVDGRQRSDEAAHPDHALEHRRAAPPPRLVPLDSTQQEQNQDDD